MKKKHIAIAVSGYVLLALVLVAVLSANSNFVQDMGYNTGSSSLYATGSSNSVSSGFGSSNKADIMLDSTAPIFEEVADSTVTITSDRKLIRSATVRAETKSYDDYLSWLDSRVVYVGGYYESKESNVQQRYDFAGARTLYAVIRVPVTSLDIFLEDVEAEGNVLYKKVVQDDVTDSYTDVDAHLGSLRVEQTRLNELLAIAETVEDILAIEDRLSYVRYEIESYERQLRSYDSQIEYSRVTLELQEVIDYTEAAPQGFIERCAQALENNLIWISEFVQDSGVFIIGHLPVIGVGAVVGIVVYQVKKRRKMRKEKAHTEESTAGK